MESLYEIGKEIFKKMQRSNKANFYIDEMLMLLAQERIDRNNLKEDITSLKDVEFKVFSQWGEDGIIQWLIHRLPIENKTFIEFGVQNYTEANTRLLLMLNNWGGKLLMGTPKM